MGPRAQLLGQGGKAFGGGFGDVAVGGAGAKALRRGPQAAQQFARARLIELVEPGGVGLRRVAVELGVDADGEAVAHHQQRRVGQRQAVLLQLAQGGVEVLAGGLVLPREVVAVEHVGITTRLAQLQRAALEQIFIGQARAAGLGHIEQFAQVEKVALRALLFVERISRTARAPFGDEFSGRHAGNTDS